jgi:hypothetical protein
MHLIKQNLDKRYIFMYKRNGEISFNSLYWGLVSMVLRNSADQQSLLEGQFEKRLFTRRTDLTNEIRLMIAINALHAMTNGVWGTITDLADKYIISRTFVYSLAKTLKEAGQFLFDSRVPSSHPISAGKRNRSLFDIDPRHRPGIVRVLLPETSPAPSAVSSPRS